VNGARRLSASQRIAAAHRGFGILHLAAALEMGTAELPAFDGRQQKPARSEGRFVPL
jgi:hypothetical protein